MCWRFPAGIGFFAPVTSRVHEEINVLFNAFFRSVMLAYDNLPLLTLCRCNRMLDIFLDLACAMQKKASKQSHQHDALPKPAGGLH
jgi:hypothetical protein